MGRSRNFIYANSAIRVDGAKDPHKDWYPNAVAVWNQHINWDGISSYITQNCHGTKEGAKTIETTLNTLSKYTGYGAQTSVQSEDLAYGITSDLVQSLNQLSMGSSGTAQSLLNYIVTGQGALTAMNAGFSFETRLSEFIQRLADTYTGDEKALRTGAESVYAGESTMFYLGQGNLSNQARAALTKQILADMGKEYSDFCSYIYEEVQREINGKLQPDIAVVAYKVPQKSDVIADNYMDIKSSYGSLVQSFLQVISNARLSLKNTSESQIKLGSTNDNTRLRAFITQFATGLDKKFSTICTFIFSSKASGNATVQRYLNWARIIYELIGAGQTTTRGQSEDLLVDYLIVNNYNASGTSGRVSVFNVKDLFVNLPYGNYDPPFKIYNAGGTGEGTVELNLNAITNFSFS